ncbi:MAG: hypothetical protein U5L96_05465 [Owenweeksia sp.]|nr:hypothetical protein [Owenweeksia sp.]
MRRLQTVLDTFRNGYGNTAALIPNRYNFSDGIFGSQISDGGGDMYDGGNNINTNFSNNLPYSQDVINTASTHFGNNGQYFTYKGTGIWLLAADMDGVSDFDITGNLGADGNGSADGAVLSTNVAGIGYTGFVKRVYNAGDPSINHLVIIENNPSASHTFSTYTDNDQHDISGLSNTTRLYYLLYASYSGGYIDDASTTAIMNEFLNLVHGDDLPTWASVSPDSGMVTQSDSIVLDIWLKSDGLSTGTYQTELSINTNDPAHPKHTIPVQFTVQGSPEARMVNSGCVSFSNVLQGATATDTHVDYQYRL